MTTLEKSPGLLGGYTWEDGTARARLFGTLHKLAIESGRVQDYYSDLYHDAMYVSELKGDETLWFIARTSGTHLTMSEAWRDAVLDGYTWDTNLMVWRIELRSDKYNRAVLNITEGV